MFAVAAVIAFGVALVLHLAGGSGHVEDFALAGLVCVAAHLVWTWRRTQ